MPLADITKILESTMGMHAASIGLPAVEHAVSTRMSSCRVERLEAYVDRLRADSAELQELIEAVVVPETWFFRDAGAFDALSRTVTAEWGAGGGVRRLLSVPCSTGEEPYSMAMALLDAGVHPSRFVIDAVDISGASLRRAERGVYGGNSFRGSPACRDRHFTATGAGHLVNDNVRRHVQLQRANLLDPSLSAGRPLYDVIFCRNVLIYFDTQTQARVMDALRGLLAPHGLLFLGSSEGGVALSHGFTSAGLPMAFAYRHTLEGPGVAKRRPRGTGPPGAPGAQRRVVPPLGVPRPAAIAPVPAPAEDAVGSANGVAEALQLANCGRLVEAAVCCERYVRLRGPSAEAFHLLALVREASGSLADAAVYYRKVLYLDPDHHQAAVHLALLLEHQGQVEASQILWQRARRLAARAQNAT